MSARKTPPNFAEFDLSLLQVDTIIDFDMYIWPDNSLTPVLYRSKDMPFQEDHRHRLLEADTNKAYILSEQTAVLTRYVERNLDRIISDPKLPAKAKAGILYRSSMRLAQDVLERPDAPENLKRSEDVVRSTISYILQGKDAFHQLMALTSYDYYTYTHSVNVCTIGLALAEKAGMRSQQQLMDFGVGAIFHDIGKTKISPSILRKRGSLTKEEWVEMKRHPELGISLLDPGSPFTSDSKAIILQHHERPDGTGYPKGLRDQEIHPFARVAAIADAFDAMTSKRCYKDAVGSYPALKTMKEEVGAHFDPDYYRVFVLLLSK